MLPFGRAILVMLVLAVIGGAMLALRPAPTRPELLLWLPAKQIRDTFQPLAEDAPGLRMELIAGRPLNIRLLSMFMGGRRDAGVPDLVTIEASDIGSYFRPPPDAVGLLPLDAFLDAAQAGGAWRDRLSADSLRTWTRGGQVFGIPLQVHPVALAYRDDLWQEAGIDLAAVATWAEFAAAARRYAAYWRSRGQPQRLAFETQRADADRLDVLLLQRGVQVVDERGVHLDDPRVAELTVWWAGLAAGPAAVGFQAQRSTALLAGDLAAGSCAAFLCPDWRIRILRDHDARGVLAGRLRVRPLPVWAAGDPPTSVWGGTMLGITRAARDPQRAWRAVEALALSATAQRTWVVQARMLPAVRAAWTLPETALADPWLGGQAGMALYAQLAPQVPRRVRLPETGLALTALARVVARATQHLDAVGAEGLEALVARELAAAQREVAARIRHARAGAAP